MGLNQSQMGQLNEQTFIILHGVDVAESMAAYEISVLLVGSELQVSWLGLEFKDLIFTRSHA